MIMENEKKVIVITRSLGINVSDEIILKYKFPAPNISLFIKMSKILNKTISK